jgi:phosphatidylinositol alpha-1,6-mannosyltransferase
MAPPYQDGAKCLVRDIALNLERVQASVMSVPGAPPLERTLPPGAEASVGRSVELLPVYRDGGDFAPSLAQNLRAASYLLWRARADLLHFVFAPNPRTSRFGAWLRRTRAVSVVQTIASPPRSFDDIRSLLFGDIVVCQSSWTRERVEASWRGGPPPRLAVIPPPVPTLRSPSPAEQLDVRRRIGVAPDCPLFVYPGDLETSSGAARVADVVDPLVRDLPDAVVVFAYRKKTRRAALLAEVYQSRLDREHVRFAENVDNVLALLATSTAVLFPVDDLWGKVDLPIVLLEAMALGVPVVTLDWGPLRDLHETILVPPDNPEALVRAALDVAKNPDFARDVAARQRAAVRERYDARGVARRYEDLYLELLGATQG